MPQNKFEVLRDRVMQRGEGSGKEIGKDKIEKETKEDKKKEKIEKDEIEKKKEKTKKKKDMEIATEEEIMVEKIDEKREIELRE